MRALPFRPRAAASLALLLATCLASVLAPGGPAARAQSAALTPVSIALDWLPNTNHTGIYAAKQEGWYAAEGLDVTILPYAQGNSPDVQVAAGKADFGISFEESVTMARAAQQPIVSLAAILQRNTSALVTLASSDMQRPADLQGKRYAGFGSPFEAPVINAVLACDGVTNPSFQTVTANLFGVDAVQAKQADFVWIFLGWEGIAASRHGVQFNSMSPLDYCIPNYYTPVIVTNEGTIASSPDVVTRFMRATARGYTFAATNPDDAAADLLAAVPAGTFPDPDLVRESAAYLAPKYMQGKTRWGEQDLQVWTDYPRFMIQTGHVTDASGAPVTDDLDYASFFTNDFLP